MHVPELNGLPTLHDVAKTKGFDTLDAEDFMKILLAELQSQNPLEPLENGQLLEQINAMNSLTSSQKLIEALDNITLSQSLGSASNLIGKTIAGSAQAGAGGVSGLVEKAVVEDGRVFLMVGDVKIPIENVTEIS